MTARAAVIPDKVLDAGIGVQAFRLYAVLALTAQDHPGAVYPSRRQLADRLRVSSLRTVDAALHELIEADLMVDVDLVRWSAVVRTTPAAVRRRRDADEAAAAAFRRIGERDGFHCRVCGVGRTLTVDHIIAVVNGGTDDDDNFQLLCRSHNSSKGTS